MRLKDKVAIVTGAGSGIAKEIALAFSREGAKVSAMDISESAAVQTAEEIKKAGGEAIAVTADVSKKAQVDAGLKKTVDAFGKLDILVSAAGILRSADLAGHTEDIWDETINVNLKGTFLCIQSAVPEMLKQGKGKIVAIASIAGQVGFPNSAAYCASKGGVAGLVKGLGMELAPVKINVNGIAPGDVRTALNAHLLADPAYLKSRVDQTPYGRVGEVQDIAPAAVYLASEESDFVTGAILTIDGGFTIQ